MASRKQTQRIDSIAPTSMDPIQVTAYLRAQLSDYVGHVASINSTLKDVNQIHTELDVEGKPISLVKARIDRHYEQIGHATVDELSKIDALLETLDRLEKMAGAIPPSVVPPPISAAPSPALSAASSAAGSKRSATTAKRRKTDLGGSSAAPSPAASRAGSPLAHAVPATAAALATLPKIAKATGPQPIAPAIPAHQVSPAPSSSSSVATSSALPRKPTTTQARKAAIKDQLPLEPGRQVAFKVPKKAEEEWILAKILICIGGDKNRYQVEDVDYNPKEPTPEQGKYNTTLKSIIPLPDPRNKPKTYPTYDLAAGTRVLGLYPDTTSFYRGIVASGPTDEPVSDKGKKKEKVYKLLFDDDGNVPRSIPIEYVVESP